MFINNFNASDKAERRWGVRGQTAHSRALLLKDNCRPWCIQRYCSKIGDTIWYYFRQLLEIESFYKFSTLDYQQASFHSAIENFPKLRSNT